MALIPAGAFTMGDRFGEGYAHELPLHDEDVSAFFMDKYAVTSQQWFEVGNWALAYGYAFDNPGSGKAANHPAQQVSWYDCVKWCNARSQMEGRTPCYYTNAAQTLVYRGGSANLSNDMTPDYSYYYLGFRCVRGL
jgi:formylglycine-generating enzyme required for sulfatase activity